MNQTTRTLLRVLDRIERNRKIEQRRQQEREQRRQTLRALYAGYKAKLDNERGHAPVPWEG